jgi:hypothetical protein
MRKLQNRHFLPTFLPRFPPLGRTLNIKTPTERSEKSALHCILFLRKTLIGAARSRLPDTVNVYNRLLLDDEYRDKLSRLVSDLTLKTLKNM